MDDDKGTLACRHQRACVWAAYAGLYIYLRATVKNGGASALSILPRGDMPGFHLGSLSLASSVAPAQGVARCADAAGAPAEPSA